MVPVGASGEEVGRGTEEERSGVEGEGGEYGSAELAIPAGRDDSGGKLGRALDVEQSGCHGAAEAVAERGAEELAALCVLIVKGERGGVEGGFGQVLAEAGMESEGEHQGEERQVEEPGCQVSASCCSCG